MGVGGAAGETDTAQQRPLPDRVPDLDIDRPLAQMRDHEMHAPRQFDHNVVAEQIALIVQCRIRRRQAASRQQRIVGYVTARRDHGAARGTAHRLIPGEPACRRFPRTLAIGAALIDAGDVHRVTLADAAPPEHAPPRVGDRGASMRRAQVRTRLDKRRPAERQHRKHEGHVHARSNRHRQAPSAVMNAEP